MDDLRSPRADSPAEPSPDEATPVEATPNAATPAALDAATPEAPRETPDTPDTPEMPETPDTPLTSTVATAADWIPAPFSNLGTNPFEVHGEPTTLAPLAVLERSVDLFLAHWRTFVALSLPAAVLSLLLDVVALQGGPAAEAASGRAAFFWIALVSLYVTIATILAADDARAGRPVSAARVLQPALRPTGIAAISALVVGLILVGLVLLPFLLLAGGPSGVVVGLILIGLAAVAIYGLLRWSLAPVAIGLDRQGPLGGLNASWRITKKSAWRLAGLLLLVGLVVAPWSLAGILFHVTDYAFVGVVIGLLGAMLVGPILPIATTLAYGDLTGRPSMGNAPADPNPNGDAAIADGRPAGLPLAAPGPTVPRATGRQLRQTYIAGAVLIGLVLLVPSIVLAAPTFGSATQLATNRGAVLAGTGRDDANPCTTLEVAEEFATSDTIYVSGFFSRTVQPTETVMVEFYMDGDQVGSDPLPAADHPTDCFYMEPIEGLPVGSFRFVARGERGMLAEGAFRVK
jgi:hypothetical protein